MAQLPRPQWLNIGRPLTPPARPAPDTASTQAGYETLRRQALVGSRGVGWALVVRRGLGAWVAATACLAELPPPIREAPPGATRLPAGLHAEVALLLAGMVLPAGREGRA